jgi:glycosyltransferase involved in cell wall biosynthesis
MPATATPSSRQEPPLLKILYHHRTRSRDGQSVHIDEMIAALRADGHSVAVVEPARVDALQPSRGKQFMPRLLYEVLEFGYSGFELLQLVRAIRKMRPDGIYERANVHMLSGVWAARLFSIPLLLEVNAPLAEEREKFGGLALPGLARWTEAAAWRGADRVLPVTAVLARYIERAGVPRSRIVVTPNGVNQKRFAVDAMGTPPSLPFGAYDGAVLGFVGYIREWHGLPHIVDLMAADETLKNTRLLVVGDGPGRAALERRAAALGIVDRVHVTGVVERDHLAPYIRAFDVALQPEVTPYASPLKLFEYMALGRAIIAPDAENIREILEGEKDSLLFQPDNARALGAAVRRLVVDVELRRRLGAAAAAKIAARDLTWRHNAETAIRLISELRGEKQ